MVALIFIGKYGENLTWFMEILELIHRQMRNHYRCTQDMIFTVDRKILSI